MKESKLTELIRGLTLAEFKKFGDYANSSFANKSQKITQLYNLVYNNFEIFDSNVISRKKIAEYAFPGERTNDQKIRALISNFTKILEEYLTFTELRKDNLYSEITLLKALDNRNINKAFEMASKEIEVNIDHEFNRNIDYYFNVITYKDIILNHENKNLDLNMDRSLSEMSEYADAWFIVTKLKILNAILSRKFESLSVIKAKLWAIDEIITYIEKDLSYIQKTHPTIYSEYEILMMKLKPETESHFHALRRHVFKNIKKYNDEEILQVYYSLTNYCVNKIAIGESRYLHELFKIYLQFEKHDYYLNKTNMQYTDFLSIIICGINLKEMSWVEYFTENYKGNLDLKIKRDTVNLANALIMLAKGKYKESIDYLNRISYKYSYFYLKSKETFIKLYYEQKEFESIETVIDSAKHYLKRHKAILFMHYDRYMLFLNFINRLIKIEHKDKISIKELIKDLDKHRGTIAREWIIEKLIELQ